MSKNYENVKKDGFKMYLESENLSANTIRAYLAATGAHVRYLFLNSSGKRITPRGIADRLKFFADKYGIDRDVIYPHSFRHRYAKNFLEKFSDIALLADLMGHESIETTRIYLRRTSLEQQEIVNKIVTW